MGQREYLSINRIPENDDIKGNVLKNSRKWRKKRGEGSVLKLFVTAYNFLVSQLLVS